MDFSAFDTKKLDQYAAQAKASWGTTEAYREYEEKTKERTGEEQLLLSEQLMDIFKALGAVQGTDPAGETPQLLVQRLRAIITEHYYSCTPEILQSLGVLYSGGGRMTENIDKAGGEGTAAFAQQAIEVYCAAAH